jgi:prepilin-type N-terminal cleavage/methylation domain-containing protein
VYLVKSKKGFTLVELVVVIAILAILAVIAIPVVSQTVNSAVLNTAVADAKTLEDNLMLAKADVQIRNQETYGASAANGTLTIGEVVQKQGISKACETRRYYNRDVMLVWNQDTSSVELMYADDKKNVETGVTITNYVELTESSTDPSTDRVSMLR